MAAGIVDAQTKFHKPGLPRRLGWLRVGAPYLLALFFALGSLRGISSTGVTQTDAARHAMNGVFIYDLVRTGHLANPIAYAKEYYARLPSLSMPFHPPVFPAIEAIFFALFGVNLLAARLAVAVCVGICAILLYRLVQRTLQNDVLAACVTVSTLSVWTAQFVATDVMLEFPSMVFALAALYCLRDFPAGFSVGRALLFGVLGALALWTKQHAVFVAGVPILYALFSRNWRLLLKPPVWISTAIIGIAVGGLVLLSAPFNYAGANRVSTSLPSFIWNLGWNVKFYREWLAHNFPGMPGFFAAGSLAAYLIARSRRSLSKFPWAFYLAWILSVPPVLLLVSAADPRYLIYLLPPLFAVGYGMLFQGGISLWGNRLGWVVPAGVTTVWLAAGCLFHPEFLRGPAEAAAFVERGAPVRVLYAGEADGNFIFAARSLDPKLQTTIIPAGKLPGATFSAASMETFCHFYGINWIIFEDVPMAHSWSGLRKQQPKSMHLEKTIPIDSTVPRWRGGVLKIYRFLDPGQGTGRVLQLPVRKLGGNIALHF
jgi:Dolichyl-phosphate-mannose-protein mannosyltransferase